MASPNGRQSSSPNGGPHPYRLENEDEAGPTSRGEDDLVGKKVASGAGDGGLSNDPADPGSVGDEDEDEQFVYPGDDAAEVEEEEEAFTYKTRVDEVLPDEEGEASSEVARRMAADEDSDEEVRYRRQVGEEERDDESVSSHTVDDRPGMGVAPSSISSANGGQSRPQSYISLGESSAFGGDTSQYSPLPPLRPAMHPSVSRLRSAFSRNSSAVSVIPSTPRSASFSSFASLRGPSAPQNMRMPSTPSMSSLKTSASILPPFPYASSDEKGKSPETRASPMTPTSTYDAQLRRDPFQFSPLRRLSAQIYPASKAAKLAALNAYGTPTVMAVSGVIAVGTSRGWVMVFEYNQDLRCICGTDSLAKESGAVTALAISHDHTFVGVGHERGHVRLYELQKPNVPARSVAPVTRAEVASGRREGHLAGSKILHIAFVAARHTAIVTADEYGLSFYHALGKVLMVSANDTLRILGRYPDPLPSRPIPDGRRTPPRKPSTIFAMAPLPLGPVPHMAERYQFIALLTPAKLVIVGLKPAPRTWFRRMAPRGVRGGGIGKASGLQTETGTANGAPGEMARDEAIDGFREAFLRSDSLDAEPADDELAGTLAWYPSRELKGNDASTLTSDNTSEGATVSSLGPVLAYSFGRRIFVLHFTVVKVQKRQAGATPPNGSETPRRSEPEAQRVDIREGQSFQEEDTVLAMQWLSHHLLLVMTRQSLSLYDLRKGSRSEKQGLDLWTHDVLAHDWYRRALRGRGSGTDEDDQARVAESRAHSFRCYKGKVFLLTRTGVLVGTLVSWADRILACVRKGDFLQAIDLATAFYTGEADGSTVGLPDDRDRVQAIVGEKLRSLMTASVQYAFAEERMTDGTHDSPDGRGVDRTPLFEGLVATVARACLALNHWDVLFEDLYEPYRENGIQGIFVSQLEPFVVNGFVRQVPPNIVQQLIQYHATREQYDRAETIIWHVDPLCLDLDQALSLCQTHRLYDALIYVYTRAMRDFVSPVVELLGLIRQVQRSRRQRPRRVGDANGDASMDTSIESMEAAARNAYKLFRYLSDVLTGLEYPSQEPLSEEEALTAKSTIYSFFFSGHTVRWPPGASGRDVPASEEDGEPESTYPYLRLVLRFDAEAFLDALDSAFEDSFLNDDAANKHVNRQLLVNILLDIMDSSGFTPSDITFLQIFVARNLPKYPQFVLLKPSILHRLLVGLTVSPDQSTRDDRQLAVEYLLSVYTPHDGDRILELFERAGFFRILRSAYRSEKAWGSLLSTYLRDPDVGNDIFIHAADVLAMSSRDSKQVDGEASLTVMDAVPQLIDAGVRQTAILVDRFLPELHDDVVSRLADSEHKQFAYLRCFLEPEASLDEAEEQAGDEPLLGNSGLQQAADHLNIAARSLYITLLSRHDPRGVLRNLDARPRDFFDLEHVVSTCRDGEVFDAMLWAIDRQGEPMAAFDALDEVVSSLTQLLTKALYNEEATAVAEVRAQQQRLLEQLQSVASMGARLCVEHSKLVPQASDFHSGELWFRLLHSLVHLVQAVAQTCQPLAGPDWVVMSNEEKIRAQQAAEVLEQCRGFMQQSLSSLVSTTSTSSISFPLLFKRLVEAGSSIHQDDSYSFSDDAPRSRFYAEFRSILSGMLDTYRHEENLLRITNRLFDRDLFNHVEELHVQRQRGWRMKGSRGAPPACAKCGQVIGEPVSGGRKAARGWQRLEPLTPRTPHTPRTPRTPNGHPPVSPGFVDKGKAVDRTGTSSQAYYDEQEGFRWDRRPSHHEEEEEGEDDLEDHAVVVLMSGVAYHRRCVPAGLAMRIDEQRQ